MDNLSLPPKLIKGAESISELKQSIYSNNVSRPLIIMDAFLAQSPLNIHKKVKNILLEANIESELFTNFSGEPTTEHINKALESLRKFHADSIIAIGGGSAIDISKSVSLFGTTPNIAWSKIAESSYLEKLPLIAVPTTAGTGSEATGITVVSDIELGIKLNPGHSHLIPNVAILDPKLTISLPNHLSAFTGLDELTHAIEAYVSNQANPLSDSYALSAIRIISKSLPEVYKNGANIQARENMRLASHYAGIAFFNSSTNLAHAAGRSLGNQFKIPHGLSVAVLLPFVMKFGLNSSQERYRDIAIALGANPNLNDNELAEESIKIVESYNDNFEVWQHFSKYINTRNEFKNSTEKLIEDALSGNGIKTNRKIPTHRDIETLFTSIEEKIIN